MYVVDRVCSGSNVKIEASEMVLKCHDASKVEPKVDEQLAERVV